MLPSTSSTKGDSFDEITQSGIHAALPADSFPDVEDLSDVPEPHKPIAPPSESFFYCYLTTWTTRRSDAMQRLRALLNTGEHDLFREELDQAELNGKITEFRALNFRAILAISERSELAATEYLEMAAAVATTPEEHAIVEENRAANDLAHGRARQAAERCTAMIYGGKPSEGLWSNLLLALYRLGDEATVDATLVHLATTRNPGIARLVSLMSSDPEMRGVCARPGFARLAATVRHAD